MNVELHFQNMDDFEPVAVIKQVAPLSKLLDARQRLTDLLTKLDGNDDLDRLLQEIVQNTDGLNELKAAAPADAGAAADRSILSNRHEKSDNGTDSGNDGRSRLGVQLPSRAASSRRSSVRARWPATRCRRPRARSDRRIRRAGARPEHDGQPRHGRHDQRAHRADRRADQRSAQRSDARGGIPEARSVVARAALPRHEHRDVARVSSSVCSTRAATSCRRISRRRSSSTRASLFKKIYEEEYGTFGGHPFSVLIGDFEFGRHPQDIGLLEKISNVAAAAHAPFICGREPAACSTWRASRELGVPRDLAKKFESSELIKWRGFRESEDSRYVTLVLPHVLMRLPVRPDDQADRRRELRREGERHRPLEVSVGQRGVRARSAHHRRVRACTAGARRSAAWKAAVWSKACRRTRSRRIEGDVALKCPTEIAITDRREKELNDLGFIALCHGKGSDNAAFFGGADDATSPKSYNTDDANANARISAHAALRARGVALRALPQGHHARQDRQLQTRDEVDPVVPEDVDRAVRAAQRTTRRRRSRRATRCAKARVDVTDIPGKPGRVSTPPCSSSRTSSSRN